MRGRNTGNIWLKVDWSQSGDGKGAGLDRETCGGGQGPFWLSGAVLVVRGHFGCQGPFWLSGAVLVVRGRFGCQGPFWL